MLTALRTIATTWPFVLSVLTLIGNDAWLKYAYPGVVSGKLSDFVGIAIVSLLLFSAYPRHRTVVGATIIMGFIWWKSPTSQPAIDALNHLLPLPIGRTVDYTDAVAFLVMPLCAVAAQRPASFAIANHGVRRLLLWPVIALTTFGLMATSTAPIRQSYEFRGSQRTADFDRQAIAITIAQIAAKHGLTCPKCEDRTSSAEYIGNEVTLWYEFTGPKEIHFYVIANSRSSGAYGRPKANRLRDDLEAAMTSAYKGLEYGWREDLSFARQHPPVAPP